MYYVMVPSNVTLYTLSRAWITYNNLFDHTKRVEKTILLKIYSLTGKIVPWENIKPTKNAVQLKVISDWTHMELTETFEGNFFLACNRIYIYTQLSRVGSVKFYLICSQRWIFGINTFQIVRVLFNLYRYWWYFITDQQYNQVFIDFRISCLGLDFHIMYITLSHMSFPLTLLPNKVLKYIVIWNFV